MSERWDEEDQMRNGHKFARQHRQGMSLTEIAVHAAISEAKVRRCMSMINYRSDDYRRSPMKKPKAAQLDESGRPPWSYPDPITLRLVREAREDMKRVGW